MKIPIVEAIRDRERNTGLVFKVITDECQWVMDDEKWVIGMQMVVFPKVYGRGKKKIRDLVPFYFS